MFFSDSDEHKGYRCWDPVTRRMRISRDVTFDESRPFYPCSTSSTSTVGDLSFLSFPDSPPVVPPISPSPPDDPELSTLTPSSPLSSPPSSPSSPVSSSPSSSPVATSYPTFPFYYTRRSRGVTESSDAPSTSGAPSQPTYSLRTRPCPAPDVYSPGSYSVSSVSEPTTYREAVVRP